VKAIHVERNIRNAVARALGGLRFFHSFALLARVLGGRLFSQVAFPIPFS